MDEGKILLVNLSKGDIGDDESLFFGTILTSFIWMAAYQRTKIPEQHRRDFFLYVDEFQNFATPGFSEIASEGRKYHVPLIVSHQNIAQIKDKDLLKVIVGNAHTIICLKASPDDEAFILPYMTPVVEKGDIVNLTPYHFFMKTTADESEDAFSGITVPLTITESEKTKDAVVANSRKQFATPLKSVEAYMEKLFGQVEQKKKRNRGGKGGGPKETEGKNDLDELVEG
jgi:TraM recognition site of TraD and TraG